MKQITNPNNINNFFKKLKINLKNITKKSQNYNLSPKFTNLRREGQEN